MTEEELHSSVDRGKKAEALLANPIFKDAFEKVDAECVRLWREAKDTEAREGFWLRLQALQHVRTAVEAVVKDGDVSSRKLKTMIEGKRRVF